MDELTHVDHDAAERPHITFGSGKSTGRVIHISDHLGSCPLNMTQTSQSLDILRFCNLVQNCGKAAASYKTTSMGVNRDVILISNISTECLNFRNNLHYLDFRGLLQ
jgi:hypothetical protein